MSILTDKLDRRINDHVLRNWMWNVHAPWLLSSRRHLATRVKEHGHSTSSSAVRDHLSSCPTCQSEYSSSSFRVIDTARNDFEVTIKEALHIKNSKPALNRQLFNSGHPLYLIFFRIITTCTERVCTQRVSTCTEHVINMYWNLICLRNSYILK